MRTLKWISKEVLGFSWAFLVLMTFPVSLPLIFLGIVIYVAVSETRKDAFRQGEENLVWAALGGEQAP